MNKKIISILLIFCFLVPSIIVCGNAQNELAKIDETLRERMIAQPNELQYCTVLLPTPEDWEVIDDKRSSEARTLLWESNSEYAKNFDDTVDLCYIGSYSPYVYVRATAEQITALAELPNVIDIGDNSSVAFDGTRFVDSPKEDPALDSAAAAKIDLTLLDRMCADPGSALLCTIFTDGPDDRTEIESFNKRLAETLDVIEVEYIGSFSSFINVTAGAEQIKQLAKNPSVLVIGDDNFIGQPEEDDESEEFPTQTEPDTTAAMQIETTDSSSITDCEAGTTIPAEPSSTEAVEQTAEVPSEQEQTEQTVPIEQKTTQEAPTERQTTDRTGESKIETTLLEQMNADPNAVLKCMISLSDPEGWEKIDISPQAQELMTAYNKNYADSFDVEGVYYIGSLMAYVGVNATAEQIYKLAADPAVLLIADRNIVWEDDDEDVDSDPAETEFQMLPEELCLTPHPGDVTGDERVTAADARLVLRYAAKLEEFSVIQMINANIFMTKQIRADAARMLLRYSARLEDASIFKNAV